MKYSNKVAQRIAKFIHDGYLTEHDKSTLKTFAQSSLQHQALISKILSNKLDLTNDIKAIEYLVWDKQFQQIFKRKHHKIGLLISEQIQLFKQRGLIINPGDETFIENGIILSI